MPAKSSTVAGTLPSNAKCNWPVAVGDAAVPSGASTGEHDAVELRDGNPGLLPRQSVEQAVDTVNTTIAGELLGLDARSKAWWTCHA